MELEIELQSKKQAEKREQHRIKLIVDGRPCYSLWHGSPEKLTDKMKSEAGLNFWYDMENTTKKAGHLKLNAYGNYNFYKWKMPKGCINTMQGKLKFDVEVGTIDEAQALLDHYRSNGRPAACTHKRGRHQVYKG